MQLAGDKRGAHRHIQKRPVRKVSTLTKGKNYLSDIASGGHYWDGNYYEVWNYGNGYNGCVDPIGALFSRDLSAGSTGYDVFCLQKFLVSKGFGTFVPTGYYGIQTMAAVKAFQQASGITPLLGFFGPKTRTYLSGLL